MAEMRIDVGMSIGTDGVARNDGVSGTLVTVTATSSATTHQFRIVTSTGTYPTITDTSGTGVGPWTFTPSDGAGHSYLLELIDDLGLSTESVTRRTLRVPTTNLGFFILAPNETADPDASEYNKGALVIARSNDNVSSNVYGWQPRLDEWFREIDSWKAPGGDLGGTLPNPEVNDLTISGEAQGSILYFNGSNWTQLAPGTSGDVLQTQGAGANPQWAAAAGGGATDHGALTGLGDDDHTQYLLASGARAMSGGLNMGTNAITNVGNVDGVDVSAHDHSGAGQGGTIAHGSLSGVGTNTHAAIDSHIADSAIHSTGLQGAYDNGNGIQVSGSAVDITHGTAAVTNYSALRILYSAQTYTALPSGLQVNLTGAVGFNSASDIYGVWLRGATNSGAGDTIGIHVDSGWDSQLELGTRGTTTNSPPRLRLNDGTGAAARYAYIDFDAATGAGRLRAFIDNGTVVDRVLDLDGDNGSIQLGSSTFSATTEAVQAGWQAHAGGTRSVAIGRTAHVTASQGIAIGSLLTIAHTNSFGIGRGADSTASHQGLLGGATSYITELIAGGGDTDDNARSCLWRTSDAATEGVAGWTLTVRAGNGGDGTGVTAGGDGAILTLAAGVGGADGGAGAGADAQVRVDGTRLEFYDTVGAAARDIHIGNTPTAGTLGARAVVIGNDHDDISGDDNVLIGNSINTQGHAEGIVIGNGGLSSGGDQGGIRIGFGGGTAQLQAIAIGSGNTIARTSSIVLGNASDTNARGVAIGAGAGDFGTGVRTIAIGYLARSQNADYSVTVGYNNDHDGRYGVSIGSGNNVDHDYCVVLGYNNNGAGAAQTTAANQFIVGSTTGYITEACIAGGLTDDNARTAVWHVSDAASAATAGWGLEIRAGDGLTSGAGGDLRLSGGVCPDSPSDSGSLLITTDGSDRIEWTGEGEEHFGDTTDSDEYWVRLPCSRQKTINTASAVLAIVTGIGNSSVVEIHAFVRAVEEGDETDYAMWYGHCFARKSAGGSVTIDKQTWVNDGTADDTGYTYGLNNGTSWDTPSFDVNSGAIEVTANGTNTYTINWSGHVEWGQLAA